MKIEEVLEKKNEKKTGIDPAYRLPSKSYLINWLYSINSENEVFKNE